MARRRAPLRAPRADLDVVYRPLPWLGFRASMPWEYNLALVIAPSVGAHVTGALDLSLGVSSVVPGVVLNRNALQAFDVFLALGVNLARR